MADEVCAIIPYPGNFISDSFPPNRPTASPASFAAPLFFFFYTCDTSHPLLANHIFVEGESLLY